VGTFVSFTEHGEPKLSHISISGGNQPEELSDAVGVEFQPGANQVTFPQDNCFAAAETLKQSFMFALCYN
jgi:hypothetical protein